MMMMMMMMMKGVGLVLESRYPSTAFGGGVVWPKGLTNPHAPRSSDLGKQQQQDNLNTKSVSRNSSLEREQVTWPHKAGTTNLETV